MSSSILIAGLVGPVLVVAAITMLAKPDDLHELGREFLSNRALIYVAGVLAMVGGLAILRSHNIWTADWRIIVTIFGWALTIGGALRMALPAFVQSVGRRMLDNTILTRTAGALWLIVGAFLTYKGYF